MIERRYRRREGGARKGRNAMTTVSVFGGTGFLGRTRLQDGQLRAASHR
jgi:hypothetical protein